MEKIDEKFMKKSLELARIARALDEVPVGAIVVKDGEIIRTGFNKREISKNALTHAELIAIDEACKTIESWRLNDCTLYVTLEPCPMCMGAIINSRIKRVVFGTTDSKAGAVGTVVNLNDFPFNHKVEVTGGVLQEECAELLSNFFKDLRERKSN